MVHINKIKKLYWTGGNEVKALDVIELQVKKGEFVVVRGPSGSGKTTLLLTIGGMLRPTSGVVTVNGNDIYALNERNRARFRADNIGFIFQMFYLLPYLSTIENVMLSTSVGTTRSGRTDARELLRRLNLSKQECHKPSELSAGELQRTAIARALLKHPRIILADEPTGNLDPENADEIIRYLAEFQSGGGTVILVTHKRVADQYGDRIIHLKEGHIEESFYNK